MATAHPSAFQRFSTRWELDKATGCWLWCAATTKDNYGWFDPLDGSGRAWPAHRWIYTHIHGPVRADWHVDHVCHNADPNCPGGKCGHRLCVNPAHLEAVPRQVNINRGRHTTRSGRCINGHELVPENLYMRPDRPGRWTCRPCNKAAHARRKARLAA